MGPDEPGGPRETSDELCEESRRHLGTDPSKAVGYALEAVDSARTRRARAQALVYLANAHRRAGDLAACRDRLLQARAMVPAPELPPAAAGYRCYVDGCLQNDLGRYELALDFLGEAETHYRRAGDPSLVVEALVTQSKVLGKLGDQEVAGVTIKAAMRVLSVSEAATTERARHTAVATVHNLALHLLDSGQNEKALEVLSQQSHVYAKYADKSGQLRREWLIGRALAALRKWHQALKWLRRAKEGFAAAGYHDESARLEPEIARCERRRLLRLVKSEKGASGPEPAGRK